MFLKGSSAKSFSQGWTAGARMWANLNSTYMINWYPMPRNGAMLLIRTQLIACDDA